MSQVMKWQAWALMGAAVLLLVSAPLAAQDERLSATPPPGGLAQKTADLYRQQARYPAHSWALDAGTVDPLKDESTPSVRTFSDPDKADGPVLSVWSDKVSFEYPKAALVYASLSQAGDASRSLRGEVVDAAGLVAGQFDFLDDGAGPDKVAGDGIYTARLDFLKRPHLADNYLVKVEADLGGGEVLHGVGGFAYSRPWARLTGKYRDELRDGDVVVSAQVKVEEAGRFHLIGTLASVKGQPIGVAQAALELEPGYHWIDLAFYGLMFHDRQIAGPFRVASLSLSTTGGMPNAKSELVTDALVTKAYALPTLSAKSYGDPDLEEVAKRLDADAARAKREAAGSLR